MAVRATEIRGDPLLHDGRAYVPVARRTEVRFSFRGAGVVAHYDRPVRIDVPGAPSVRVVDWDLVFSAAVVAMAAAALTIRRRR
jgi:hypothetical protein